MGLLLEYLPSIVITASNFVVPFLCDQMAKLEKYSPSLTVILALLRLDTHTQLILLKIILDYFVKKSKLRQSVILHIII